MDYKAYYQDRRNKWKDQDEQIVNSKLLGQFPLGFSRKTQ
jgi:hypothetical protein